LSGKLPVLPSVQPVWESYSAKYNRTITTTTGGIDTASINISDWKTVRLNNNAGITFFPAGVTQSQINPSDYEIRVDIQSSYEFSNLAPAGAYTTGVWYNLANMIGQAFVFNASGRRGGGK